MIEGGEKRKKLIGRYDKLITWLKGMNDFCEKHPEQCKDGDIPKIMENVRRKAAQFLSYILDTQPTSFAR